VVPTEGVKLRRTNVGGVELERGGRIVKETITAPEKEGERQSVLPACYKEDLLRWEAHRAWKIEKTNQH